VVALAIGQEGGNPPPRGGKKKKGFGGAADLMQTSLSLTEGRAALVVRANFHAGTAGRQATKDPSCARRHCPIYASRPKTLLNGNYTPHHAGAHPQPQAYPNASQDRLDLDAGGGIRIYEIALPLHEMESFAFRPRQRGSRQDLRIRNRSTVSCPLAWRPEV